MDFKVWCGYLVKYGKQEDGKTWGKEKLKAVTPNLVGRVAKLPDGSLALVIKMEFNEVGLYVHAIPKNQVEEALRREQSKIIIPDDIDMN